MQMHSRKTYLLWGLGLFSASMFVGLVVNFPRGVVTDTIRHELERATGWSWEVKQVGIRWNGIGSSGLIARLSEVKAPVVSLKSANVSLLESLFGGPLLRLRTGKRGRIRVRLPWSSSGKFRLRMKLPLEELSIWQVLEEQGFGRMVVGGDLRAKAMVSWSNRKVAPQGSLEAMVDDLSLGGLQVLGFSVPKLEIGRVQLRIESDGTVQLRELRVEGDWEGEISGSIQWNASNPRNSVLSLQAQLTPRQNWMEKLGGIRPLLEGYLKQGQLRFYLEGHLAKPRLRI